MLHNGKWRSTKAVGWGLKNTNHVIDIYIRLNTGINSIKKVGVKYFQGRSNFKRNIKDENFAKKEIT